MKSWLKDLFHVEKPVIALLHIREMPGDFYFDDSTMSMREVIDTARRDLIALQDGGVDGILFSNEYSFPYQMGVGKTDYVTSQCMARVIGELMRDIRVPYGVNVIEDGLATVELARAVDASFVRCNFTGCYVGELGLINTDIARVKRRKKELGIAGLHMLYNVNPEFSVWVGDRDVRDVVKSMVFNCDPDGLCVSGQCAGFEASSDLIRAIKDLAPETPVFANNGCRRENIAEKLSVADSACVGTAFKYDGVFRNTVDVNRVRDFMEVVREYRKTL
ncbi:BtpA/SgcQ family protein [Feifania hominis]|uniref:BtpA/SgcQ family protein n=1 Tax=Feifania hominis TaxID=2763660 RepID=A0A926DEX4_9FIRM|nr:BtpA/SgcQ family protein [Feifania hominis]MBC8535770.1 BtpA/SgcQ family protein [Feifania hominis]